MSRNRAPEDQRRDEILAAAYRVAARERLTGLTVRGVAAEAGVSSGLVLFYFASKDALLVALLDWLLARTIVAHVDEGVHRLPTPQERLLAVVRHDIERLPEKRARVELFFDFWVMGTRHRGIQRTIRSALDRYRDAFLPLAQDMVDAEPERYAAVGARGLATNVSAFVEGCALRAVLDPGNFDVELFMETCEAFVAPPVPARPS